MTIGIIVEYNPFHNGHIYHINKIKEMYPDSTIIAVLSGSLTQRGDLSIINKWDKTAVALNHNIDLVIELPSIFSSQAADYFCFGSIKILNYLKVDKIVFGSEVNDIEILRKLASIQLNNNEYDTKIKDYMKSGLNYPTALSKALFDITGYSIKEPNDILGIGYIREMLKNNYNIEPITIKRNNNYNSTILEDSISSALSIRTSIKNNIDISKYVPKDTLSYLNNPIFLDNYYELLRYKIISEINNLDKYQGVSQDIIPRIKKYIYEANSLDELILNIKSKNYTYNNIKRMLTHILMSITKEECQNIDINYIRILGFNNKGKIHLNKIKKDIEIPLITKYDDKYLNIESRISSIINYKDLEYKHKPIIKEN